MENKLTWSYNPILAGNKKYYGSQQDWNQTILTKFNQLSNISDNTNIVVVPEKFKKIIDSFLIDVKYDFIFSEAVSNIIIGDYELEIIGFID